MSDDDDWEPLEWQFGHAVSDAYKKGRKSMQAERDAAIARAEAAEAQVQALTAKVDVLLAVAQQVVDNAAATCDRMWVSDAELADMARDAIARAVLAGKEPADGCDEEARS